MSPQTIINIVQCSFTIATVRSILRNLEKDCEPLINFHTGGYIS